MTYCGKCVFLSFYEMTWFEQHASEFKAIFYKRYVDVLFEPDKHLSIFYAYFNTCHSNMPF